MRNQGLKVSFTKKKFRSNKKILRRDKKEIITIYFTFNGKT